MSETQIIKLGGKEYSVAAVPMGRLKVLLPALSEFSRAANDLAEGRHLTEADLTLAIQAISAGLGMKVEEVEDIPATLEDLINAVGALAEVSGLTPKGKTAGESSPVMPPATALTPSTA